MSFSKAAATDDVNEMERKIRKLNIILFGESGVGKSAVVNQIFDKTVVKSSDQAVGCTLLNTKIEGSFVELPEFYWNIFDTVGLSESSDGSIPTINAFVQLIKLAYVVPGGINLIVCCHGKGRIGSERFKANYRIFKEELCENRIPCLLVITKCEGDEPLNQWWIENEQTVRDQLKFRFVDAVCVSTVRSTKRRPDVILEEYAESRKTLMEAIIKHSLNEAVQIDGWSRKVIVAARNFFNQIQGWLPWLRLQRIPLRQDLVEMFRSFDYPLEEAKKQTEILLKELTDTDLLAPYQEIIA